MQYVIDFAGGIASVWRGSRSAGNLMAEGRGFAIRGADEVRSVDDTTLVVEGSGMHVREDDGRVYIEKSRSVGLGIGGGL